jgi:hypothetical protein
MYTAISKSNMHCFKFHNTIKSCREIQNYLENIKTAHTPMKHCVEVTYEPLQTYKLKFISSGHCRYIIKASKSLKLLKYFLIYSTVINIIKFCIFISGKGIYDTVYGPKIVWHWKMLRNLKLNEGRNNIYALYNRFIMELTLRQLYSDYILSQISISKIYGNKNEEQSSLARNFFNIKEHERLIDLTISLKENKHCYC